MTSMLKDLKDTLTSKFTGQKYHNNLLGESISDQLRKATSKTLVVPDEELNQQVVETINQEISSGKDSKEVAWLLKKRLRTDNPQKQWLGVQLLGKVMRECSGVVGLHQEELLQEVARVMARPAKPETEAGKKTRQAAKDMLRTYGRAGTSAFRAANREGMPPGAAAAAGGGTAYAGYTPAGAYAVPSGGVSGEKASIMAEVQMLIDQAKANTELLSEMLVNQASSPDEFERDLTRELVTEVRELRDLFTAYLEQMQSLSGADAEDLLMRALEATDMLDGALALEKEVEQNQREFAAAGGPSSSATAAAAHAPAAPAKSPMADLIALDDLAEALTSAAAATGAGTPAPAGAYSSDPFAASAYHPISPTGSPAPPSYMAAAAQHSSSPAAIAAAAPGQPGMQSAFANMFAQPGSSQAFNSLASAAPATPPGAAVAPPPSPAQQQYPQMGQPVYPVASQPLPMQGYGSSTNNPFAGSMPGMPAPAATPSMGSNNPFAAPPVPTLPDASSQQPQPSGTVEAEWDMFFANRTAQVNQANAGNVQQLNADFAALMSNHGAK